MLTLKVYGNYSPNTVGLPGSCYLLEGMSRKIIFDLGNEGKLDKHGFTE